MSIKDYNESILITDTTIQQTIYVCPLDYDTEIVGYYPLTYQDIRILKEIKDTIKKGHSCNICKSYQNFSGIN